MSGFFFRVNIEFYLSSVIRTSTRFRRFFFYSQLMVALILHYAPYDITRSSGTAGNYSHICINGVDHVDMTISRRTHFENFVCVLDANTDQTVHCIVSAVCD